MSTRPSRAFRRLCAVTAAATYLLIVAGGVVRVSGSGLGCGATDDWPLCEGRLLPPLRQDAIIEFTHRWLAATATALVVILTVTAWARHRQLRRITRMATAVLVLFTLQIVLGAITVKLSLPGAVILLHLANAMLLLGALVYIGFVASTVGTPRDERRRPRLISGGALPRHAVAAAAAAAASYVLILSGALVVARGAGYACAAWPLCGDGLQLEGGGLAAVNLLHRLAVGAVLVLVAIALPAMRRAAPGDAALRRLGALAAILLVAQVAAGALVVDLRLPAAARGVHLALASALWALLLLIALMARTTDPAGVLDRPSRAARRTALRAPRTVRS